MKEKQAKTVGPNLFKRNLVSLLAILFILSAFISGITYSWFVSGPISIVNAFTAGTVLIDVTEVDSFTNDVSLAVVAPNDCVEKKYTIINEGTKSIYVRALFEAYWKYTYHKNTATVTAEFGDITVSAWDKAHYYYENLLPAINSTSGSFDNTAGFTANKTLSPDTIALTNYSNAYLYDDVTLDDSPLGIASSSIQSTCEGPLVEPEIITGNDPDRALLASGDCEDLQSFKLNFDQNQIESGKTYRKDDLESPGDDASDPDSTFAVAITVEEDDDGIITFKFESQNHAVYHVFVKGGQKNTGHLYSYYPDFPNGVYEDCGLVQAPNPQGVSSGWSHITFYYCPQPPAPEIDILKEVSVDGGTDWHPADVYPGPELLDPDNIKPMFQFTVTNTGNVPLDNVIVNDPDLGQVWGPVSLGVGEDWTFTFTDDNFTRQEVDLAANITLQLCPDMNPADWDPSSGNLLGKYIYYKPILFAKPNESHSANLCVEFCLTDDNGIFIPPGAELVIYSYFEAVQTTHGIKEENWTVTIPLE